MKRPEKFSLPMICAS